MVIACIKDKSEYEFLCTLGHFLKCLFCSHIVHESLFHTYLFLQSTIPCQLYICSCRFTALGNQLADLCVLRIALLIYTCLLLILFIKMKSYIKVTHPNISLCHRWSINELFALLYDLAPCICGLKVPPRNSLSEWIFKRHWWNRELTLKCKF